MTRGNRTKRNWYLWNVLIVEKNLKKTKPKLRLDWATHKAALFACQNWHYSRSIPKSKLVKIGVWENDKFIGVLIYSYGATPDLVKPYGCTMQQGCELTRIALNRHETPVSKMMALSFRFLKKHCPGLRVIVSFADPNEGHHGGIYQATNWYYTGRSTGCYFFKHKRTGRMYHPRNVSMNLSLSGKSVRPTECEKIWKDGKHRYVMPLHPDVKRILQKKKLPYPKRTKHSSDASGFQSEEGGAIPTRTLQAENNKS